MLWKCVGGVTNYLAIITMGCDFKRLGNAIIDRYITLIDFVTLCVHTWFSQNELVFCCSWIRYCSSLDRSAGNMKYGCGRSSKHLEKAARMLPVPTAAAVSGVGQANKKVPTAAIVFHIHTRQLHQIQGRVYFQPSLLANLSCAKQPCDWWKLPLKYTDIWGGEGGGLGDSCGHYFRSM